MDGERRLVAIRATVPAEVFFNTQVLVDTPLNTEFFRHLPGILTGIGIIGTFSGLILGLSGFQPTGPAQVVQASLGGLMEGVKEAFYASAFAIAAAMLITFIEKGALNRRYKQVEQLTQAIDALYEAGAGEEYLARLVNAAEENAVHTAQLKQSLVDDLKQILTDLTERQIQAGQQHSQQMAADISAAIQSQLQGSAVQSMLLPLVEQFTQQIQSTFGNLTQQTTQTLQDTLAALNATKDEIRLLKMDIASASKTATDDLADKLKESLDAADARPKRLEDQVAHAVKTLEEQRAVATAAEQQHLDQFAAKTQGFVGDLSEKVNALSAETIKAVQAMGTSIDKMNEGAQDMYMAAAEFKDAGKVVTGAMQQGAATMNDLRTASEQVSAAARDLAGVMASSQNAQQAMQGMVNALQNLIAEARREAGLSKQLVDDLQIAAKQLGAVQLQAGEYLEGVNKALEKAFSAFGDAVTRELGRSNAAFQSELGKGTGLLQAAFTELAAVIGQFQGRR